MASVVFLLTIGVATANILLKPRSVHSGWPAIGLDTVALIAALLSIAAGAVVVSGCIVLFRSKLIDQGRGDLFDRLNFPRSEAAQARQTTSREKLLARFRSKVADSTFLEGDLVRVKPLEEILATLDSSSTVENMPFMEEMHKFTGQTFIVHRCVDTVYDYGGEKTLRRLKRSVSLAGVRCDGKAHGGSRPAQARCSLIWKSEWLEHAQDRQEAREQTEDQAGSCPSEIPVAGPYICQYTELVGSSTPLKNHSLFREFMPLITGNVTLAAYLVATFTRLFNLVQGLRGGVGFPAYQPQAIGRTPTQTLDLEIGETVRVLDRESIDAYARRELKESRSVV